MLIQTIRKFYVLFLFLSLATFVNAQQGLQQIDAKLDSIFGHYNMSEKPGVSIAILEKNKPTVLKSYGHANLEYQIKNTPNTLFNATDLAKQFTVFSILLLADQGKLSIQDSVKKYIPELYKWPFEITLKHLMEQTSGLRDVVELKKWRGYQNGDVVTKENILELIAEQKQLNFPSGTQFEYNRTGFVLLTEVVAKVSGISFPEFIQQNIFTPLEMHHSVFANTHTELIPNRSYSYATTDNKYSKIVNNSSFVGGTNLYISTADFAKWLRNLANPKIGKPTFYEYLQTPIKLPNGLKSNYTPGIFKSYGDGYWTIHLEGFDHGYTAYMMYVPEHDFSSVIFSNDMEFSISDMYTSIYDWFHKDYSILPVKALAVPSIKFIKKPTTELQSYTGNYLFEDGYSLREIVLENDTLFYVRDTNNRTPMVPIEGEHIFKMLFSENDNIRVTFKNEGKALEFRVINSGKGNDYVSLGRKLKFQNKKRTAFSADFWNEELDHIVSMRKVDEEIQLTMNGNTMVLNQIGDDDFLPLPNTQVKYVRLHKDEEENIVGVFVSGFQLKDLYYRLMTQ